jgi:hypothetical protein
VFFFFFFPCVEPACSHLMIITVNIDDKEAEIAVAVTTKV